MLKINLKNNNIYPHKKMSLKCLTGGKLKYISVS